MRGGGGGVGVIAGFYGTFTDVFIEATVYSDYLKGGEEWISLTGLSTQNFGLRNHQKQSQRLKS